MGNKASASSFERSLDEESIGIQDSSAQEVGTLETLHNKAHDVFPVPFNGIKLFVTNGLSPNFHSNHSISLCSGENSGYRFIVNYAGHKKISESESYPVFQGDIQPNGQLMALMVHKVTPNILLKYMTQMKHSNVLGTQLSADIKHGMWQSSLLLINPELQNKKFMSCIGTMRQLTSRFALGTMFAYHHDPAIITGRAGSWSIGGRYAANKWVAALSMRPHVKTVHSSFHMRVDETLQFAAELESNYEIQTNVATIGYQYDFPKGVATVKAQVDSSMNLATTIEKKYFPFTFSLSAVGNPFEDVYNVGIGLSLMV